MDINEYVKKLSNLNLSKKVRITLLAIYAIVMFISIQTNMNIIIFILLFAVVPVAIYIFVKKIFPEDN